MSHPSEVASKASNARKASGLSYHFAGGIAGKLISFALQAVHLLTLALMLGQDGFGEYVLLQGLCTMITCVGTAWSSSYQNTIAEQVKRGSLISCLPLAVRSIGVWTTGVFALIAVVTVAFAPPLDSFRMLRSAGLLAGAGLWLSTVAASMQMLQVSILAAEGSPLILARQQTMGKAAALGLSLGCWWGKLPTSPALMLVGVQLASAIPCLFTIYARWRLARKIQAVPEKAHFQRFLRFGGINLLATGMRLLEINLVSSVFGSTGAGTFGFLVRVVSPLVTAIASGARNLWPLFHKADPDEHPQILAKVRRFQWLSVAAVVAVTLATTALAPILRTFLHFPDLQNRMLIALVTFQSVCLAWSAFSYNLFAGFSRESLTFRALTVQAGLLAVAWLLSMLTTNRLAIVGLLCTGYGLSVAACFLLEKSLCRIRHP